MQAVSTNESILCKRDTTEPVSSRGIASMETLQPKAMWVLRWHSPVVFLENVVTLKSLGSWKKLQQTKALGFAVSIWHRLFLGKTSFYFFWHVYSSVVMPHLHWYILGNPVNNSLCLLWEQSTAWLVESSELFLWLFCTLRWLYNDLRCHQSLNFRLRCI